VAVLLSRCKQRQRRLFIGAGTRSAPQDRGASASHVETRALLCWCRLWIATTVPVGLMTPVQSASAVSVPAGSRTRTGASNADLRGGAPVSHARQGAGGQRRRAAHAQAEKNMAWEAAQQQNATLMQMNAQALGAGSGPCKLYVGNLHPNISVRTRRRRRPGCRWLAGAALSLSCSQTIDSINEVVIEISTMLHLCDRCTPLCGMPSRLDRGREGNRACVL